MKVEALFEDNRGQVWIGTHDRGIAYCDGSSVRRHGQQEGLVGTGVFGIGESPGGQLILATNRGIAVMESGRFQTVEGTEEMSFLWGMATGQDGANLLCVGRRPGRPPALCGVRGSKVHLIELEIGAKPAGESVNDVAVDGDGSIWICGDFLYVMTGRQLFVFDEVKYAKSVLVGDDGVYVAARDCLWRVEGSRPVPILELPNSGANSLCAMRGAIWVSDYSGSVMSNTDGQFHEIARFGRPIQTMLADSTDTLWMGTYGKGIYRAQPEVWRAYFQDHHEVVQAASLSIRGGEVSVATSDGVWGGSTNSLIKLHDVGHEVSSICHGADGRLWFGTRIGNIYVVEDGRPEPLERPEGIRGQRVECLTPDGDGKIWYSRAPGWGFGYVREDGGGGEYYAPGESVGPSWVGAIATSRDDGIILGTCAGDEGDGVVRWLHGECEEIVCTGQPVTALAEVSEGILIGTTDGVHLFSRGQLARIDRPNELKCAIVTCLEVDGDGSVWLGTQGAGGLRTDGVALQPVEVPGPSIANVVNAISPDGKGGAWFATENGVYHRQRKCGSRGVRMVEVAGWNRESGGVVYERGQRVIRVTPKTGGRTDPGSGVLYRYDEDVEWHRSRGEIPVAEHATLLHVCSVDQDLSYANHATYQLIAEDSDRDLFVREALASGQGEGAPFGRSASMSRALSDLDELADSMLPLVLLGETGTGKTMLARHIHSVGSRRDAPFVSVNCGSIPSELAESELFGHERGAFTGAVRRRIGKFQLAHGGTLLLDEVGELPRDLQVKLLSVLQDGVIQPIGSSAVVHVDVRVIAATNRDLSELARAGLFRQDLLYRLQGAAITLPSLRDRKEDIEVLALQFLRRYSSKLRKPVAGISRSSVDALVAYEWPGNIRELEQLIHRAVVMKRYDGPLDLTGMLGLERQRQSFVRESGFLSLDDMSRRHICSVLKHTGGRIEGAGGAAEILELNPSTLRSRIRKLGLRS